MHIYVYGTYTYKNEWQDEMIGLERYGCDKDQCI